MISDQQLANCLGAQAHWFRWVHQPYHVFYRANIAKGNWLSQILIDQYLDYQLVLVAILHFKVFDLQAPCFHSMRLYDFHAQGYLLPFDASNFEVVIIS